MENKGKSRNVSSKTFFDKCNMCLSGVLPQEDFFSWLDEKILVKRYVPIRQKTFIAKLVNTLFTIEYNLGDNIFQSEELEEEFKEGMEDMFLGYETIKTLYMISQYINVEIDCSKGAEERYDSLMGSGFYSYLEEKTNKDLEKFSEIVDRFTGIDSYSVTKEIVNSLRALPNNEELKEAINIMGENEELIEKLDNFNKANNPMNAKIGEAMKIEAFQEIKEQYKKNLSDSLDKVVFVGDKQ